MADEVKAAQPSKDDLAKLQELFGLSHDLIAQAAHPGHLASKIVEVLKFLAFQHDDFKRRVEAFGKDTVTVVEAK